MPKAAEQHGDHQVAISHPSAAAVAAEWNVQVIAQPGGERDVPAPPEIGDPPREIGTPEIDREMEAEQLCHADRHIGVTGEIEIDLHARRRKRRSTR